MKCTYCKKEFTNRWQKKFCSLKCQMAMDHADYISEWKKGKKSGVVGINVRAMSGHVKRYMREKYGKCCSICGWNKVNAITDRIPLEIDHIDGDSENNSESNLRLICPNCHALTSNFKNLNKGKGRKWRMKKYIKNEPKYRPKTISLI